MLVAMNTGHEGSMTTLHANTAREALRRLETMLAMSGVDLPIRVLRQHIANSLECIVQVSRCADGVRRVVEIMEVSSAMEGDTLLTQEIYKWTPEKGFKSAGLVPSFVKKFHDKGLNFPKDFFADAYSIKTQSSKKKS
jgi:pilus assembly protein CpaF